MRYERTRDTRRVCGVVSAALNRIADCGQSPPSPPPSSGGGSGSGGRVLPNGDLHVLALCHECPACRTLALDGPVDALIRLVVRFEFDDRHCVALGRDSSLGGRRRLADHVGHHRALLLGFLQHARVDQEDLRSGAIDPGPELFFDMSIGERHDPGDRVGPAPATFGVFDLDSRIEQRVALELNPWRGELVAAAEAARAGAATVVAVELNRDGGPGVLRLEDDRGSAVIAKDEIQARPGDGRLVDLRIAREVVRMRLVRDVLEAAVEDGVVEGGRKLAQRHHRPCLPARRL